MGQLIHANFGISHGSGAITIKRPEITLPVDQRITHGKVLGHTNDCVIDGRIAMRMILTDNITDYTRRFFVGLIKGVAQFMHGKQDAPMDRFQSIPYIR